MENFSLLTFLCLTLGIFVQMLYFQLPAGKWRAWSEKVGRRGEETGDKSESERREKIAKNAEGEKDDLKE